MKIPLWGVITATAAGLMCLITIWFNVQNLTSAVQDLQITVKSGNTSVSVLASEMALLKFRTNTNEVDIQRLNDLVRQQQKGSK